MASLPCRSAHSASLRSEYVDLDGEVGRLSGMPSPQERLRALGAAVTIGTDRFGGDDGSAETLLTDAAQARSSGARRVAAADSYRFGCRTVLSDDRPTAPRAAIATLVRLLGDPDAGLIEEWAQLARSHGVVVDGATAPLLLDWWVRQPRRSEAIFAALGHRGEWLASLNADWQKHVATPGDSRRCGRSSGRQARVRSDSRS